MLGRWSGDSFWKGHTNFSDGWHGLIWIDLPFHFQPLLLSLQLFGYEEALHIFVSGLYVLTCKLIISFTAFLLQKCFFLCAFSVYLISENLVTPFPLVCYVIFKHSVVSEVCYIFSNTSFPILRYFLSNYILHYFVVCCLIQCSENFFYLWHIINYP